MQEGEAHLGMVELFLLIGRGVVKKLLVLSRFGDWQNCFVSEYAYAEKELGLTFSFLINVLTTALLAFP